MRSSSSPPNSTGSTADSDGWTPGPPTSCPQRPPKVPHDRNRKLPQSGGLLSSHTKKDVSQSVRAHQLCAFTFSSFVTCIAFCHQHSIPSRHADERRKADKLKKKKRRKERQLSAREDSSVPEFQHPVSFSGQTIKEEPEDEISIPLHPQRLSSPVPCKEEPSEEQQNWDGQDLEEGVVRVQKVEGFSGNRTVFRQGKQVVFRDEDGSGEDEDIMVDSGTRKLISLCSCSSASRLSPALTRCPLSPDDDSWDLVTCFCMKPFAGRAMIECNKCHTWIHLSCAKIRKSHVPETYVCQRCRETHGLQDTRRSHRSRAVPSKHTLN